VPRLEDVAPTLLALAGVPPPEQLRGRALLREDAAGPEVPHVATDNERVAVRRDGRKALGTWRSRTEADLADWFDLGSDPSESQPRHAANLPEALVAALLEFLARDLYPLAYEKYGGTLSAGQAQTLKELGYTD
jgi:arylsulfatase A-like enzyme